MDGRREETTAGPLSGEEEDIDLERIAHDLAEDAKRTWGRKKVPQGDIYEAARAGDCERLEQLIQGGVDINVRDRWDSVPLYYSCLAGHLDAAKALLEAGAVCNEYTFDGDRCHYASLNLKLRRLLKAYEARPPPMDPLARALREVYCPSTPDDWWPDVLFHVEDHAIHAHRAILAARSPFFREAFATRWRHKRDIWLANSRLTFAALNALLQFFYTDHLDIAMEDMKALARACRHCRCMGLAKAVERELLHQRYAEHKSLHHEEDEGRLRYILQGMSLPENERLPHGMSTLLHQCLLRSRTEDSEHLETATTDATCAPGVAQEESETQRPSSDISWDHADVRFRLDGCVFYAHKVVLAARSEYFKALFGRTEGFREGGGYGLMGRGEESRGEGEGTCAVREVVERDCSPAAFEKLLEYSYTDVVAELDAELAEELLDAASRYLMFPLKRAAADALIPQLDSATPADLCRWLMLAEMYSVWKLREFCLNTMAENFEVFAATPEFLAMLASLPPPSGDSEIRTTTISAPGEEGGVGAGNVLDDLREKWLELEGGELEARDADAQAFDGRLLDMQAKGVALLAEGE